MHRLTPIERLLAARRFIGQMLDARDRPLSEDSRVDKMFAFYAEWGLDDASSALLDERLTPDGVAGPLLEEQEPPQAVIDELIEDIRQRLVRLASPGVAR